MSRLLASILGTRVTTGEGDFYVGTDGADTLTVDATVIGLGGMAGNDTLTGGLGRDFLFGDDFSAAWFDNETGPYFYDFTVVGDDKLFGGGGEDIMIGGPGNDTLVGGRGGDLYVLVGAGRDVIREFAGGGDDRILTNARTFTLGENFEDLEFGSLFNEIRKDVHGIGNAVGNRISGSASDDTLEGLAGNDFLAGSKGRDLLVGGLGKDTFVFGSGGFGTGRVSTGLNADTIGDFDPVNDQIMLAPYAFGIQRFWEPGEINVGRFGLIGSALTGKERVLYDQDTGDLMTKDHEVFAHVTPGTVLTYQDFEWGYF